MAALPANPDEVHARTPPRYRWLIRIAAGYTLLLAGLVGSWFWWDAYSRARLDAKIAALKAAGEPTRVEDFVLPDVPDERNAARLLASAAAVLVTSFDPSLPGLDDSTWCERDMLEGFAPFVGHLLEANADALCEIRAARYCPDANGLGQAIMLSQFRRLAKLSIAAALHAHYERRDDAAVEHLVDTLAIARVVSQGYQPAVVMELVAASIDKTLCEAIGQIAQDIDIGGDHSPGGASTSRLRLLIAELLDEAELPYRLRRAFQSARIELHGDIEGLAAFQVPAWVNTMPFRNTTPRWPDLPPVGPSVRWEGLALLDRVSAYCRASLSANIADAKLQFREITLKEDPAILEAIQTHARRTLDYSLVHTFEIYFERLAYRRLAAASLSIRVFETANGRPPIDLAELVPEFLPAVPLDPFAEDGRPIGYRAGPGGCVYSIGRNGTDDGGIRQALNRDEIILSFGNTASYRDLKYYPHLMDVGDE